MELTEQEKKKIKKVVKNAIDEFFLTEKSKNAKARDIRNVENTFNNGTFGYNAIKTFGVVSAENPDSQTQSYSANKRGSKTLKDELKSSNYIVLPQKGVWGGVPEWSYFIVNITIETLTYFAGKFQQTSFIFARNENGKVISEYWEKSNPNEPYSKNKNPYIKKDECDTFVDAKNDDTGYSVIGNTFKYRIPFKIFEETNRKINDNLSLMNEDTNGGTFRIATKGVGMNGYNYRKKLYKGLI